MNLNKDGGHGIKNGGGIIPASRFYNIIQNPKKPLDTLLNRENRAAPLERPGFEMTWAVFIRFVGIFEKGLAIS